MQRVVLFPGSFDPFTRGHAAVVSEALALFDRVVVAIGYNVAKSGFLTLENRKRLVEDIYRHEPRVECITYDTLTIEAAAKVGACAIIRGVRTMADFETERTLDAVNRRLLPAVKSVVVFTPAELQYISSSAVRELLAFGAEVTELLPQGVNIDDYLK